MQTLPRGIGERLINAVARFPVTILEGGRAVGKSTICRQVAAQQGWASTIDLTLPDVIDHLNVDPLRFLRQPPSPAVIDEAQLAPQLPLWWPTRQARLLQRRRPRLPT